MLDTYEHCPFKFKSNDSTLKFNTFSQVVPMVTMASTAARFVPAKAQSSVIPRMAALVS